MICLCFPIINIASFLDKQIVKMKQNVDEKSETSLNKVGIDVQQLEDFREDTTDKEIEQLSSLKDLTFEETKFNKLVIK